MKTISDYPQLSQGVYDVGTNCIDILPFLHLFSDQSAQEWVNALDEALLMMVNSQVHTEMDADDFANRYFDLHVLRETFKKAGSPKVKPKP